MPDTKAGKASQAEAEGIEGEVLLAPFVIRGVVLFVVLVISLLLVVFATGELEQFLERDGRIWADRNARLAVLAAIFAAYMPAGRAHLQRAAVKDLRELQASKLWRGRPGARAEGFAVDRRGLRRSGGVALLLVPLTSLLVDRDLSLYVRDGYWGGIVIWTWLLGGWLAWQAGELLYTTAAIASEFTRTARDELDIDLLNLAPLAPYARQGLRSAVPGVVLLSFYALNLSDKGFLWAFAVMASLTAALTTTAALLTMRGARDAIRAAKQREGRALDGAIRGEEDALVGTLLAGRTPPPSLADLIAYRGLIEGVREWPFDASAAARFLLYLGIPLGSWLGGAMVERMLDAALD